MNTGILYAECSLAVNKAFCEYREACRESEIRSREIALAFMESTIDEHTRDILFEASGDESDDKKKGIIATIIEAIKTLIQSVIDAIAGIFKEEQIEEKCDDLKKVAQQTDNITVKSPDYKKQLRAQEKYSKRMQQILSSGKDAEWIQKEQQKAQEQYEKDLKSNFNPKLAVGIGLGVAAAGAIGCFAYLKSSGKTLKGCVQDYKVKSYTNSIIKGNTKNMDDDDKRRTLREMEVAEERRIRAMQNCVENACRNLERTNAVLLTSIDNIGRQLNEDDYRISETSGTGNPITWFKNKWYKSRRKSHESKRNRLIDKYNTKQRDFRRDPKLRNLKSDIDKHTGMLEHIRNAADKEDEKLYKRIADGAWIDENGTIQVDARGTGITLTSDVLSRILKHVDTKKAAKNSKSRNNN